jgi:hypothetical protein
MFYTTIMWKKQVGTKDTTNLLKGTRLMNSSHNDHLLGIHVCSHSLILTNMVIHKARRETDRKTVRMELSNPRHRTKI